MIIKEFIESCTTQRFNDPSGFISFHSTGEMQSCKFVIEGPNVSLLFSWYSIKGSADFLDVSYFDILSQKNTINTYFDNERF